MSTCLVIALLLSSFQLIRVAAYTLKMSPDHVRVSHGPQSVYFTCNVGTALTGCQFTWRDYNGKAGPLLELSRGSESQANSSHLNSYVTGYSYSGRGLGVGDCGVSLQGKDFKIWLVACRVRAETGGWTYAWSDLFAASGDLLPHTLTPRECVVLPGGEARVTMKAQEPLSVCHVHTPGRVLYFSQGAESSHSAGRHRYLGSGLPAGECGLMLTNVSEADNGPVRGWIVNTARTKNDHRFMALIIARPPSVPTLSVVYTGFGLMATCEVPEARPVASIAWVLGDDVIRQDSLDDRPGGAQDEWRWPWMPGSIAQTLTLRLQPADNGKLLKCVASHAAWPRPLEATQAISFTKFASESLPVASTSTTARVTVHTLTTAPSNCTCTAARMLDLLCQELKVRASQLGNPSCPRVKGHEYRVRESRTAQEEEQAKVTLELSKVTLDAVRGVLSKLAEEQARVAVEAAEFDEQTKARMANVALDTVKAAASVEEETQNALAKIALEAAVADEETKSMMAKAVLEAVKSSARAEEARAREEEAWATNAEEELEFNRIRRGQLLQQSQSPGVQSEPTNTGNKIK